MSKSVLIVMLFLNGFVYSQQANEVFNRGIEAHKRGDNYLADSLISLSIKYDGPKTDYLKYYNRGIIRMEIDSIRLATLDFEKSISIQPTFYPSYENLSLCYYYSDKTDKAINCISKGLEVDKTEKEGYVLGAIYSLSVKSYDECITMCTNGLKVSNDPRLLAYRSVALSNLKSFQKSDSDIQQLKKDYGVNDAYYLDALIYYQYLTKSTELCKTAKNYFKLYSVDRSPVYKNKECFELIKTCT